MGLPRGESLGRGQRGVEGPLRDILSQWERVKFSCLSSLGNKNIEEWSKFTAIGVILLHAIA